MTRVARTQKQRVQAVRLLACDFEFIQKEIVFNRSNKEQFLNRKKVCKQTTR